MCRQRAGHARVAGHARLFVADPEGADAHGRGAHRSRGYRVERRPARADIRDIRGQARPLLRGRPGSAPVQRSRRPSASTYVFSPTFPGSRHRRYRAGALRRGQPAAAGGRRRPQDARPVTPGSTAPSAPGGRRSVTATRGVGVLWRASASTGRSHPRACRSHRRRRCGRTREAQRAGLCLEERIGTPLGYFARFARPSRLATTRWPGVKRAGVEQRIAPNARAIHVGLRLARLLRT